jgi:hypothetical protein
MVFILVKRWIPILKEQNRKSAFSTNNERTSSIFISQKNEPQLTLYSNTILTQN